MSNVFAKFCEKKSSGGKDISNFFYVGGPAAEQCVQKLKTAYDISRWSKSQPTSGRKPLRVVEKLLKIFFAMKQF